MLGSQLDDMTDSVQLASKNRLDRLLHGVTYGSTIAAPITTLRGGGGVSAPAPGAMATVSHGPAVTPVPNPQICGIVLAMEAPGPRGREEVCLCVCICVCV